MSYKVLRLIEYTYPDATEADRDMGHWSIPPVGSKTFGAVPRRTTIRSSIIQHPEEDE